MIDEARLEELRRDFEARRRELETLIQNQPGVKMPDDLDNADAATLAQSQTTLDSSTAVRAQLENELFKVEAALQRVGAGAYGKCENCGKEISERRLRAEPFATLCEDCMGKG